VEEKETQQKIHKTFTDNLRIWFKGILDPIARLFNSIGLMPNTMTILGVIGNVGGAILLARGEMFWGGVVILIMGPIDALDGTMARLRGMDGRFGGFVDSVSDRYSELIIYGGLLYYFVQAGDNINTLVVYAAAAGSVLVSYIRARSLPLGWETKVGILTRVERYLVLAPALILNYPAIGLWIIAIFANITAFQRIYDVRRQAREEESARLAKQSEKVSTN
jgi:CDP-diacylglycerol--glycerol-3-phosphate 3-phosphatidyltransferase